MKNILHTAFFIAFFVPVVAKANFTPRTDEPSFVLLQFTGNPTIKIFPNPASDYIELTDNEKIGKIVVFNLVGKEMKRFDASNGQRYNISELPKGMYLVQLLDKSGQTVVTQRVSKR